MSELPQKQQITFDISTSSIIKLIAAFLILSFLYVIKEILAILFVALIFASAVDPCIDYLQRKKIPRGFSILFIYFLVLGVISLIIALLIPAIETQVGEIASNFPVYYEKIVSSFSYLREYSQEHGFFDDVQGLLNSWQGSLSKSTATGVFSTLSSIFGSIISFFVVLVITFYMVVEESAIKRVLRSILPDRFQPYVSQLVNRMQRKVGDWLRGQLVLCLIIGILSFVALSILGVKYALVLALIAGLTEFIPYLGPFIGAVPAIFIAFSFSPAKALGVLIAYTIIQQIENNILVPKIMQKAVGLNPIVSIVALMIGFRVGGVVGALLAIPVTTALSVAAKDFMSNKEEGEV